MNLWRLSRGFTECRHPREHTTPQPPSHPHIVILRSQFSLVLVKPKDGIVCTGPAMPASGLGKIRSASDRLAHSNRPNECAVSLDQGRDLPADSGGWLRHCNRQRCLARGASGAGPDPQAGGRSGARSTTRPPAGGPNAAGIMPGLIPLRRLRRSLRSRRGRRDC